MMPEYRYHGVKISTVQTGSGRWLAHSGYGDTTADSEAQALSQVRPIIDRNVGESTRAAKIESERIATREAKRKQYLVRFSDGHESRVTAMSAEQAKGIAKRERFGRQQLPITYPQITGATKA